jgi:glycosyltransferase involved in cell wall biosynthesis
MRTRNLLLKEIRGDYVAFQDADDLSEPERIASQLGMFTDPDMMLCGTWARYFINRRTVSIKKTPSDWADIKEYYKTKNPFCSASIMFRRKVIEEIGVFREYFLDKGNYDYDFTSRIVERYPSCNIQKSLYNVRLLPDSNSRNINSDYPIKFESYKIVQFLIEEREHKKRDSLMNGDLTLLKNLEESLLKPYKSNEILVFDKQINKLMDSELNLSALWLALRVILIHKFSIQSIHLFLYSLKRLIL